MWQKHDSPCHHFAVRYKIDNPLPANRNQNAHVTESSLAFIYFNCIESLKRAVGINKIGHVYTFSGYASGYKGKNRRFMGTNGMLIEQVMELWIIHFPIILYLKVLEFDLLTSFLISNTMSTSFFGRIGLFLLLVLLDLFFHLFSSLGIGNDGEAIWKSRGWYSI